jgi:uncharacterized protein
MSAGPALLVFARAPVAGEVKTRLAAAIGGVRALAAYRELLATTIGVACAARDAGIVAAVELWCTPDEDAHDLRELALANAFSRHRQPDGDLGARMEAALADALRRAPAALLIGTDCPVLTPVHLANAAATLAKHDAVLIPAEDGGYVLVGARRPVPLRDVRWSTAHALADTRDGFARAGVTCACLPPLWDVDDDADLARFHRLREPAPLSDA